MIAAFALVAALATPPVSLEEVRRESNLEKRSERALEYAEASLEKGLGVVKRFGPRSELESSLEEVVRACELSLESLRETGKRPGKLSKQYKRGELRTRGLIKEMADLAVAISVDDRPAVEQARDKVILLHEEFLLGVMSGK